ncbi:hypothetical protein BH09PSE5_BH09PSE5_27340 [soil metagenome]
MVTKSDVALMKTRMTAARNALKYFTDKVPIRSTNNPFNKTRHADQRIIGKYRLYQPRQTIMQSFADASHTGVGNCDEKARILYASLVGNPTLNGHSVSTIVSGVTYDHVYVVMDHVVMPEGEHGLDALSPTGMVIDGWTEDWYFPNLSSLDAVWQGLSNVPNPRQLWVRKNIAANKFKRKLLPNF